MLTYDAFKTGLSYRSVYAMMWSESEDTGTWRYKGRSGVLGYWRELKAEMYDVYTRTNDRQYARDFVMRRRSQRYAATFLRRLRLSRLTRRLPVYTTKNERNTAMKTTIFKITTTPVEVEIPSICPSCNTDFREGMDLQEESYASTNQPCIMSADGEHIEDYSSYDSEAGDLVTGYRCLSCNHVLASTEVA